MHSTNLPNSLLKTRFRKAVAGVQYGTPPTDSRPSDTLVLWNTLVVIGVARRIDRGIASVAVDTNQRNSVKLYCIMNETDHSESGVEDEIVRLRQGGQQAVADLFSQYRTRLERMVEFRIDRRLLGRVDSADVLQDAYIEIARRIDGFLETAEVSFFVWARQITYQTLLMTHRRHFGQKRSPDQEIRFQRRADVHETSFSIAQALIGQFTPPSRAAVREEQAENLRRALDSMDELDREVLALRHFEHLTNGEVSEVLGLSTTAASNRYVRALKRLKNVLTARPGFEEPA